MPCSSAKARARARSRLPTATTSTSLERAAPASSLRLMWAVERMPQRTGAISAGVRSSTSGLDLQPARDRVERDGHQQDRTGHDEDDAGGVAERVQPVRDRRDHERAEERVAYLAASAEEARAADHGCRDPVDQERAAAGVEIDAREPRGQHDAAHRSHEARDHEDEDPDARHVDARAAGRLGVAAYGVDMTAEGGALGDERPDQQHRDDQEERERDAAVAVADRDGH